MKIILLGEHSKGHSEPFPMCTLSGKRLRTILSEVGLVCDVDNVFNSDGTKRDLATLCKGYDMIIALGRIAWREIVASGIATTYLPHPASRSKKAIELLRNGLKAMATGRVGTEIT